MMQEEDYLLRMSAMIAEVILRVTNLRTEGRLKEALAALVNAQETLFGRSMNEIARLPIDDQIELLAIGETAPNAAAKMVAYAATLTEAGHAYRALGKQPAALSAFQLALYILLRVVDDGGLAEENLAPRIQGLIALVPDEAVHAPTRDLLRKFQSASPSITP